MEVYPTNATSDNPFKGFLVPASFNLITRFVARAAV